MKICPKCAAENADTAKFCNECGASLGITDAEVSETVSNPESVLEAPKEGISSVENEDTASITITETMNDAQESVTEQTAQKNESTSKNKSRLIICIAAIALICIIGYMATRPKLISLDVTYNGDTSGGVVLDSDNEGFIVSANYSDGKKKSISAGEWQIEEPKTLQSDGHETVVIKVKDISQAITIYCSTTKLQSVTALYNGSKIEGTIINKDSDFTVKGTFGDGHTKEYDNTSWYLTPAETTLKAGETSKITISMNMDDGTTWSADLEITGTEKPFAGPEVEGDHFNCSINQFVKYVNEKTVLTLFPIDKVFGEEYDCYGIKPPNEVTEISNEDVLVLAMRENQDGKLQNCVVYSLDETSGMAAALQVAKILDDTVDTSDKSKLASFVTKKTFATNKIAIWMWQQKDSSYNFHIMTADGTKKFYDDAMDKYGDMLNNN